MTEESQTQSLPGDKLVPILNVCQKINSERDLTTLLDLITREATTLLGADRASLFLLDAPKGELWSKVALGSDEVIRFDARLGIAGAVAATGETINVCDARHDPKFYPKVDNHTGYHTSSLLAAPLRNHAGRIIGVFEVLNKRMGTFNKEDEEILKALAAQAAVAIETAQLVEQLNRRQFRLQQENTQLRKEVESRFRIERIIGTSPKIQAVLSLIRQISDSSVNVLITGESGTGKELVAKALHFSSSRVRRPFVALNCAALPESLIESELFGIEKGVASGVERRIGKFEEANGGTLFLDEIGDLSAASQAKILRALQERVVEHVGGRKEIPVDVRIVAATNKDLESEIKKGSFRQDLYYRLKVGHIHMPPLREVREDIPLLANYFLANHCREMNRQSMELTPEALRSLKNYSWPGNIRELENEMKRLAVMAGGSSVLESDLSQVMRPSEHAGMPAASTGDRGLKAIIANLEKQMISDTLKEHHENQQHAAKALGLSRQGLIKKMKRYGIKS